MIPDNHTENLEFLDREYNPRLRVADSASYFSQWQQSSIDARARLNGQIDIRYGASPAEKLDFFPAKAAKSPLLQFIHGGFWRALDKRDFSWVAAPYVDAGISVAIVNYGLAPSISIEEIVLQLRHSCLWLYHNAGILNVDPQRLVCSGHSAGGHLCGMMLATDWPSLDKDAPQTFFSAAVAVSGLFDLLPLSRAPFLRDDINLDDFGARKLSPAFLKQRNPARILLAVGELESDEFHRQSELLSLQWRDHSAIRKFNAPSRNHFSVCDAFADPDNALFKATIELIVDHAQ